MVSSASPARAADKLIGEVLANRYLVEERLGEGAMGAVYKARHVKVGRAFAVKVLHAELLEDDKVAQRFEREAELAGRLRHPNVIGVVDVGETSDGLRYMVMDFAEGESLADLLAEAPMPAPRILNLTRQLLEGLYHAHEAGLIHRDFKPENVIVERDAHDAEVPRIVDFGIAILREGGDSPRAEGRLTTNGLVLGTPHYMAPEQAVADPIDHRIDLFALGIVVYEMLCGKLPFDGSGADVARANLLRDPPPIEQRVPYLEVDPLLEAFSRRLMAKKRDQRPATAKAARELLDLIERDRAAAAAELGVMLTPSTRIPAATEPVSQVRVDPDRPSDQFDVPAAAHAVTRAQSVAEAPPDGSSPASDGNEVSTVPSPPLAYDEAAGGPRRPTWIVAGIGVGLAVAGGIAALVLAGGRDGDRKEPPANEVTTPIVMPTSEAARTDDPASGAAPDTAIALAPDTASPDTASPDTTSPDTASGTGAQGAPNGTSDRRAHLADRRTGPDRTRSPRTKVKASASDTERNGGAPNATNVARKYQEIGSKLRSMSAADDLWSRYRLIRISDAMRDPAKLQQTSDALLQLEREIAARKKSR